MYRIRCHSTASDIYQFKEKRARCDLQERVRCVAEICKIAKGHPLQFLHRARVPGACHIGIAQLLNHRIMLRGATHVGALLVSPRHREPVFFILPSIIIVEIFHYHFDSLKL